MLELAASKAADSTAFDHSGLVLGGEAIPPPKPISWYPGLLAWRFEVSRAQLRGKGKAVGFRSVPAATDGSGAAAEAAAEGAEGAEGAEAAAEGAAAAAAVPPPEETAEEAAARVAAAAVEAKSKEALASFHAFLQVRLPYPNPDPNPSP